MQRIKNISIAVGSFSKDALKCYSPFIAILVAFASFRWLIPELSENIHYTLMPNFDRLVFGELPTIKLQHLLWHGHVVWYDYALYGIYASHYILPVILAWVIYKNYATEYIRFAATYLTATFTAFLFFIIYPTAPPWLASQNGYIPHINRIAESIFSSIGVHNFGSLYSSYVPNPIATLPSLHTTYAILFVLFIYRIFGKRWAAISLVYPVCIIFGVIYMGEHYAFDVIAGVGVAVASYAVTPLLIRYLSPRLYRLASKTPLAIMFENDLNE